MISPIYTRLLKENAWLRQQIAQLQEAMSPETLAAGGYSPELVASRKKRFAAIKDKDDRRWRPDGFYLAGKLNANFNKHGNRLPAGLPISSDDQDYLQQALSKSERAEKILKGPIDLRLDHNGRVIRPLTSAQIRKKHEKWPCGSDGSAC